MANANYFGPRCRRFVRYYWGRLNWKEKMMVVVTVVLTFNLISNVWHLVWDKSRIATGVPVDNDDQLSSLKTASIASTRRYSSEAGKQPTSGEERMRQRQQTVNAYCSMHGWIDQGGGGIPPFRTQSVVSKARSFFYCPVGKMASTFLTRFLVAAVETNPVVSPFAVPASRAMRMRTKHSGKYTMFDPLQRLVESGKKEVRFLEGLTKILFVRCPFQRLWSAYVDKVLSPNPYYWEQWGLPAVMGLSQNSTQTHTSDSQTRNASSLDKFPECGQSVTFPQFLDFVLSDLGNQDTHVQPVGLECSPCYVNYDVIGHVETLVSDVMHLTSALHLNNASLIAVAWDEEYAKDVIAESAQNVFQRWTESISRCMTMLEASKRLWRSLQLRGVISEKEEPPFSELDELDVGIVVNALHAARSRSARSKAELTKQKDTAFSQAYKLVNSSLKDKIRNVYAADFQMFGFDLRHDL